MNWPRIRSRAWEACKALACAALATGIAYGFGLGAGTLMFGWPA